MVNIAIIVIWIVGDLRAGKGVERVVTYFVGYGMVQESGGEIRIVRVMNDTMNMMNDTTTNLVTLINVAMPHGTPKGATGAMSGAAVRNGIDMLVRPMMVGITSTAEKMASNVNTMTSLGCVGNLRAVPTLSRH